MTSLEELKRGHAAWKVRMAELRASIRQSQAETTATLERMKVRREAAERSNARWDRVIWPLLSVALLLALAPFAIGIGIWASRLAGGL